VPFMPFTQFHWPIAWHVCMQAADGRWKHGFGNLGILQMLVDPGKLHAFPYIFFKGEAGCVPLSQSAIAVGSVHGVQNVIVSIAENAVY
jgi:hypothetical protein